MLNRSVTRPPECLSPLEGFSRMKPPTSLSQYMLELWLCGQVGYTERTNVRALEVEGEVGGADDFAPKALVAPSCPTLGDPVGCRPPGSIHGVLQARVLEWGAIPFSWGSSRPRDWTQGSPTAGGFFTIWVARKGLAPKKVKSLRHARLLATPWAAAHQAPPMGFSRQEYWSGVPFPSPEGLPDPGIKPASPMLQADTLPSQRPSVKRKNQTSN